MVIFDDELSAKRNSVGNLKPVKNQDIQSRSLILDIFAMRAQTANTKSEVNWHGIRIHAPHY